MNKWWFLSLITIMSSTGQAGSEQDAIACAKTLLELNDFDKQLYNQTYGQQEYCPKDIRDGCANPANPNDYFPCVKKVCNVRGYNQPGEYDDQWYKISIPGIYQMLQAKQLETQEKIEELAKYLDAFNAQVAAHKAVLNACRGTPTQQSTFTSANVLISAISPTCNPNDSYADALPKNCNSFMREVVAYNNPDNKDPCRRLFCKEARDGFFMLQCNDLVNGVRKGIDALLAKQKDFAAQLAALPTTPALVEVQQKLAAAQQALGDLKNQINACIGGT